MTQRIIQLLLLLLAGGCGQAPSDAVAPQLQLSALLGGTNTTGFLRAEGAREFRFPEDHGRHPGFRNEWWYFTGNLQTDNGRHFGYQLTFFTAAVPPVEPLADSAWAADTLWMAHLAVTDVSEQDHRAFERFSRANPGLAGAVAAPLHLWLDDWQVLEADDGWHLRAKEQGVAIDLLLNPLKPPVLQGDQGLSRKGDSPGNASWYYSMTRLGTQGSVTIARASHQVNGLSWLDREWSTSALEAPLVGWDWLSLQFDDNTELMLYQMRDSSGTVDRHSEASMTDAAGSQTRLAPLELAFTPQQWWQGPDGENYATGWELQHRGRRLRVEALVEAQFLPLALPYWEGAVRAVDLETGATLGHGYLEMVRQ